MCCFPQTIAAFLNALITIFTVQFLTNAYHAILCVKNAQTILPLVNSAFWVHIFYPTIKHVGQVVPRHT